MSRRRKGGGGRVTPPRTRPRNWNDTPAPAPRLAPPPELDKLVPRFDSELAVVRDREAAAFVSLFLDRRPQTLIDLQGGDPDVLPTDEFLDVLSSYDPMPQAAADTIAAFAVYGGRFAPQAQRMLKQLRRRPSPGLDSLGQATITSSYLMTDLSGDVTQFVFGLSYPDGDEGAVSVLIDNLLGGVLKDTLAATEIAHVLDEAAKIPEIVVEPVSVALAAAAVDHAYRVNDGATDMESIINEDVDQMRPMVEAILDGEPRDPDYRPKLPSIDGGGGLDDGRETGMERRVRALVEQALDGVDLGDPDAVARAVQDLELGAVSSAIHVPPAGGTHPEPFDSSGLGAAAKRATMVGELASASARAIFDEEYVTLVRRVTTDAVRANPGLFARGRVDIWASGVVYAVAQMNDMIGGWGPMSLDRDELMVCLAGAPGTISSKAASIRAEVVDAPWGRIPRYMHTGTLPDFGNRGGQLTWAMEHGTGATRLDALADNTGFVLRCQLLGMAAWRKLRIPASATLHDLHLALQLAFEWKGYHLHEFTIGANSFTDDPEMDWALDDETEVEATADFRLDELLRPDSSFFYIYDFGDFWQVEIRVEAASEHTPGDPPMDLIDGAGDSPPEDVGGSSGYASMLEALDDAKHPDHESMKKWAREFRPGPFDLDEAAERFRAAF